MSATKASLIWHALHCRHVPVPTARFMPFSMPFTSLKEFFTTASSAMAHNQGCMKENPLTERMQTGVDSRIRPGLLT